MEVLSKIPPFPFVTKDVETVTIAELSKSLKWSYPTIYGKTDWDCFEGLIVSTLKGRAVRIEDVERFLEVLYKIMGEVK